MLLKHRAITVLAVFVFISSGISVAVPCFARPSAAELSDGLVSAWPLDDGNAKDYVGSNHAEIKGGVEVVDGKFEKAYSFNGKDGHLQIPHHQSMEVITDAFTVSAWFYPEVGVHGNSGIVTKGEGSGWGIKYAFKITLNWWGVSNNAAEGYFNASGALNRPGNWVFACLTADGKEAIGHAALEDGKIEIRAAGEGNPKAIASPYLIEADFPIEIGVARMADGNTHRYFDGIIKELRL